MRKILYIILATSVLSAAFTATSCSESEKKNPYQYDEKFVTNVYLNTDMIVYRGQNVVIHGTGFEVGDELQFVSEDRTTSARIESVGDASASFLVPMDLEKGTYGLSVARGYLQQSICKVNVWITTAFDVPDLPGYNIKGAVYCDGVGIQGVRVSDGITTTVTNENGFYWIDSDKTTNGYVFINIPSGYMPNQGSNVVPGFWMSLSKGVDEYDECNFELKKVDNNRHCVVFGADIHLSGRTSVHDVAQFKAGFYNHAEAVAEEFGLDRTYTILLGDIVWDKYWYVQKYFHTTFKELMSEYNMPLFNNMGNHDNDPWVQGNLAGEAPFKRTFGPNYYAMNIGKIHYIILDSIAWINTGGTQGHVGERNYGKLLVDNEWKWFREDLAAIEDKATPIVVCLHVPLYNIYNSQFALNAQLAQSNSTLIMDALKDFSNVKVMAGHEHRNSVMKFSENVIGWTLSAVSECWWWCGEMSGRSICGDGTPAGIGVFEVDGRDIEWYYLPWESERDKQFYAYDMNVVKPIIAEYKDILNTQTPQRDTYGDDYATVPENAIYVNVWNWDEKWTVEVIENGASLAVERVYDRDPLHTLCYDVQAPSHGLELSDQNASIRMGHMFRAVASSSTSTVTVKVTDRFGNEYKEVMSRPKAFNTQMK